MKRIFLFLVIFTSIFSEGPPRERKIRRSDYFCQDYIEEEGRFGEMLQMGSRIYDLNGNPLEENRKYYGAIEEKIRYTFDERNRLTEVYILNEASGNRRREVYHYKGDRTTGKSIYRDGNLVDEEINVFNPDGNLARVENKRGEMVGYIYDEKGRMVMSTDGVVKNYYSYDGAGRMKRDRCEIDDKLVYKREYEYNSSGHVEKIVDYRPEGSKKPQCTTVTLYKYNERGDKTEERWRTEEEGIWYIKRLENKYNKNGDLVTVIEYETREDGIEKPIREFIYVHEYF